VHFWGRIARAGASRTARYLLGVDIMGERSVLVGLIGRNIQNSLSPALHADAFAAAKLRGYYHLMDLDVLKGRSLPELIAAVRSSGFSGINVTYPYKEAVVPLLDEVTLEARQIGAVNTITLESSGRTVGHNTDRIGFRRSLEETIARNAIADRDVVLIGAGGAGRAVAFALLDLGAACVGIFDKDGARSTALVANLAGHCGPQRARLIENPGAALVDASGLVNATPIGMVGIPGIPIAPDAIRKDQWVADVIYTPLETELIKAARAKGAQVLTGGGMCVHQVVAAFFLFTGIVPDVDRMRRTFSRVTAVG
jgi:shikimate dehydrogenase